MFVKVEQPYDGGTLLVTDVPAEDDGTLILGDSALIALYIRVLNVKNILGDIEVAFSEIKQKYEPFLDTPEKALE